MTDGHEDGDSGDYPDGSVGRYVRERWGAAPASRKTRPYVAPVQPSDGGQEPDTGPAADSSLPRRPASPQDVPEQPARNGRLDRLAGDADVDAWAERGRAAAVPESRTPPGAANPPGATAGSSAARSGAAGSSAAGSGAASPAGDAVAPTGRTPSRPPTSPRVDPWTGEPEPARPSAPTAAAIPAPAAPVVPAPAAPVVPPPPAPVVPPPPAAATPPPTGVPRTPPRGGPRWTDPGAVAAQQAQQARNPDRPDLSSARLLRPTKRPPQSGWRRLVYVLSGRTINPGESPADVRRRELTARVNQPLLGCYKIGVLSLKGGVGKTTMTATLGATFASLRGDRVVAVDANPDRGTLSQKIPLETSATVRNLLRDAQRVRRYTDVRAYTSQGASRLEVLASEQDPAVSEAFSEDDYRRTVNLLEHFYNIVLTDCGTGLMHSAMYGVLGVADQLIIVSSGSIDGARSASATMDWLDAHGHTELVRNSVAVINCVHRSAGGVDLDRVAEHFAARCRSVVRIPFDAHLEEGAEVDLDRLEPGTRIALLELAAAVADAFASAHSTG